jgi:tetratricopeptide (TPR) repeat protein
LQALDGRTGAKDAKVAVLAVALILPLPSAGGGPPQDTWQLLERYRGVTEAYRTRGLEDAKRQIAGLSPAQIRGTVSLLHRIALDTAATGSDRPAGWNTALFGAGVVLHVELFVDGAKRGQVAAAHLECAVLLLDIYRGSEADQSLRRGATLAVAWLLQIIGGFELLRPYLKTALNDYPNDPEVLFARAVVEEASASPRLASVSNERRSAKALREAESTYRSVLRSDPALTEARVRLGYVLLRLHRLEEARHELTAALAVAVTQRDTYLAALFLAATHEAEGSADQAVASYQRAHAVAPDCQVAAFGLSHALRLRGEYETAAATARAAAREGPSSCDDPWWSYDYGQSWKLDATLDLLRDMIHK